MLRIFGPSRMNAMMAAVTLFAISTGTGHATSLVQNGNFCQIGPNGNPVTVTGPQSGWSAAAEWAQVAVVPGSYFTTSVGPILGSPSCVLHVRTNGGPWPPAYMGNGVIQDFKPSDCAVATFSYLVVSGEVTGNLITTTGHFVDTPHFKPTAAWQPFIQVAGDVGGIGFETLVGRGAEYYIRDLQVRQCIEFGPVSRTPTIAPYHQKLPGMPSSPLYLMDASSYLSYETVSSFKTSDGSVENIRVVNRSSLNIEGPIHVLLQGLTPGRGVINPGGDYFGSPFITLKSRALAPGESEEISLQFDPNPSGAVPGFMIKLVTSTN